MKKRGQNVVFKLLLVHEPSQRQAWVTVVCNSSKKAERAALRAAADRYRHGWKVGYADVDMMGLPEKLAEKKMEPAVIGVIP